MRRYSFMIIGLLVFCMLGYWSGFGYYIHMAASTMLPTDVVHLLSQHKDRTVVNQTDTSVNKLGNTSDQFNYKPTVTNGKLRKLKIYNKHMVLRNTISTTGVSKNAMFHKHMCDSKMEVNSTVPENKLSHTTAISTNRTIFYITSNNMVEGRLGNQMFIYASLLGMARSQGRTLIVSSGSELEDTFKLSHVSSVEGSDWWPTLYEEHAYAFETKLMNLTVENYKIGGYLQSFKYFNFAAQEVIQEFTFKDSVIVEACKMLQDLLANSTNLMLIGVHVRRGDFLEKQSLGYGVPEKTYFSKAFDWIKKKFPGRDFLFIVASDDFHWCRNNLATKDVVLLPDAPGSVHMAILSNCEHMIISSGSYGWWSAYLSRGYVIYFKGFMQKGTTFGDRFDPENYYLPSWLGLGN